MLSEWYFYRKKLNLTFFYMIKLELLKVRARYQSGAHNEIQTHDLFLRRETLYSAELYGHDR